MFYTQHISVTVPLACRDLTDIQHALKRTALGAIQRHYPHAVNVLDVQPKNQSKLPLSRINGTLRVAADCTIVLIRLEEGCAYPARVAGVYSTGLLVLVCGLYHGILATSLLEDVGYRHMHTADSQPVFSNIHGHVLGVDSILTICASHLIYDSTNTPYVICTFAHL